MLFKEEHIEKIKNGTKTATRRVWKFNHARENGIYAIQSRMFQPWRECPKIRAVKVYDQPLGDMTEEDANKEGGYTLAEFKDLFEDITGDKWDDNQVVTVVEFEYIGWVDDNNQIKENFGGDTLVSNK